MAYQGYKTEEEIFLDVEKAFPFQSKPEAFMLTNRGDEDCVCRYIVEHMRHYPEPIIPMEGVRYMHSELANLSVAGMCWLLPNLLRKALLCTNRFDTLTETIIYDLELASEGDELAKTRYFWLSHCQLQCLENILEYLSEKHGHSIGKAMLAIHQLTTWQTR
ncbi:hypothetical protein QWY82_19360 [Simiduia curdlanivorans]|uniref:Uncharacterized protein n=1 Tax=Simiduia curdlanivorans TaxID=1492769 RepID=A0ABV8V2T6_9GAMM|nr:hypothetical protein [Simiduia curdlanivorans]MDN3640966.1 hypothetical protein [Simiduia curdlanivorans]